MLFKIGKRKKKKKAPSLEEGVVFLDIDGVLAPFGGDDPPKPDVDFAPFAPAALARLAEIVHATGAAIVLSSSWRASDAAKAVVRSRLRDVGLDLAAETGPTHCLRQWEIAKWLVAHKPAKWVALDDENLVDGPENRHYRHLFRDRAILVDSSLGLQQEHVDRAIAILTDQG